MNLFINAISTKWILILFNNNRKIIFEQNIEILWNESSKLILLIDEFLKKNKISYFDLDNIILVNWPWSFTGVRTIVLVINSINFIINKNITSISFFDLFEKYPIIKSSSRRDLFVKYKKNDKIQIVPNDKFILKWKIYWDLNNNLLSEKFNIISNINYTKIISNIVFKTNDSWKKIYKTKLIEPLYIKKPNIS